MNTAGSRLAAGIVAAVTVGAGIGAAVASTTATRYDAAAKVLVSAKRGGASVVEPFLPNLRELATSSVVAGDVTSTLHIRGSTEAFRKRIHASTPPHTQVVVVGVSDHVADRARQITQEVAVVFARLVQARFGRGSPALGAIVLDPAHVVSRSAPDYLGGTLIGAAIGLAVALLAAAALRRPVAASTSDGAFRRRERRLEQRIATVAARETALARRAGELAARERELRAREAARPAAAAVAPLPAPQPVHAPEPARVPEAPLPPPPPPKPAPVPVPPVGWTLDALERLVEANGGRFPDRVDEWNAYLFYLRDYADTQGRIPRTFDGLIAEAFSGVVA